MIKLLMEILAELKAIRMIIAPDSVRNHYRLTVVPDCAEGKTGKNDNVSINSSEHPSPYQLD